MPYTLDIRPSGHRDFEFEDFRCHKPLKSVILGIGILNLGISDAIDP